MKKYFYINVHSKTFAIIFTSIVILTFIIITSVVMCFAFSLTLNSIAQVTLGVLVFALMILLSVPIIARKSSVTCRENEIITKRVLCAKKRRYEDIAAICIVRDYLQGKISAYNSSLNISIQDKKLKIVVKNIYDICLIGDQGKEQLIDLTNNVFLQSQLGEQSFAQIQMNDELLEALYTHGLYPICLTKEALQENYERIAIAIKKACPGVSFKIEEHNGYITMTPHI